MTDIATDRKVENDGNRGEQRIEIPLRRLMLYAHKDYFEGRQSPFESWERAAWNCHGFIMAFAALEYRATGTHPILNTDIRYHLRYIKQEESGEILDPNIFIDIAKFKFIMNRDMLKTYPEAEKYSLDWGGRWFESFESVGFMGERGGFTSRLVDARVTDKQLETLDLMLEVGATLVRCYIRTETRV